MIDTIDLAVIAGAVGRQLETTHPSARYVIVVAVSDNGDVDLGSAGNGLKMSMDQLCDIFLRLSHDLKAAQLRHVPTGES